MIKELKVVKFSHLNEFIEWTKKCPNIDGRGSWSGAGSYQKAIEIATKGVNLGKVQTELKKIQHSRPEMDLILDVTGSIVNMDAYLTGQPENMFEFPIVEQPTKFLNLFIDVTEHAYITAEQMVNKAVALASTVDDLENNGYRVSLTVGNVIAFDKSYSGEYVSGTTAMATIIKIKEHQQPLSVGQVTGCCHPSFLRMLCFRHYEYYFKNVGGTPPGIGRSASLSDIQTVLNEHADKDTIFIPNSSIARGNLSSVESALEMINNYIIT
jgi:hypothetical protein